MTASARNGLPTSDTVPARPRPQDSERSAVHAWCRLLSGVIPKQHSHTSTTHTRPAGNRRLQITLASHVESDGDRTCWTGMGPVDGPVLGPYGSRPETLEVEMW